MHWQGGLCYSIGQWVFRDKNNEVKIKAEDLIYHSVLGGLSNLKFPCKGFEKYEKLSTAILGCIDGMDISEINDLLGIVPNAEDPSDPYKMAVECLVGGSINTLLSFAPQLDIKTKKLTKEVLSNFFTITQRLAFNDPKLELKICQKICSLSDNWLEKYVKVIDKFGTKGFDFLKEINFPYMQMRPDRCRMLTQWLETAKPEQVSQLKQLLSIKGNTAILHLFSHMSGANDLFGKDLLNAMADIARKQEKTIVDVAGSKKTVTEVLEHIDFENTRYFYRTQGQNYCYAIEVEKSKNLFVEFLLEISGEIPDKGIPVITVKIADKLYKEYKQME